VESEECKCPAAASTHSLLERQAKIKLNYITSIKQEMNPNSGTEKTSAVVRETSMKLKGVGS
jgi:hypothetical protein